MADSASSDGLAERLRRNVRVVLVGPRGAANVGAVARAMKNMGLGQLVLVRPAFRSRAPAAAMAVHARDVLDGARSEPSLLAAVADCGLVVGTTCRDGPYRSGTLTPEEAARVILRRTARRPVALVFGPEDHGLTNDDLKLCHRLVRIPTSGDYPSLNLAQAVLILCWELRRASVRGKGTTTGFEDAAAADVEFAMDRLREAFLTIGFLNRENPEHILFTFRRIFGRGGLEDHDVRVLLGLARQISWYGRVGAVRPTAKRKRKKQDKG